MNENSSVFTKTDRWPTNFRVAGRRQHWLVTMTKHRFHDPEDCFGARKTPAGSPRRSSTRSPAAQCSKSPRAMKAWRAAPPSECTQPPAAGRPNTEAPGCPFSEAHGCFGRRATASLATVGPATAARWTSRGRTAPSTRNAPSPDHAPHAAFLHARPSRVPYAHAVDPSGLDRVRQLAVQRVWV